MSARDVMDLLMISMNISNIAILYIEHSDYCCIY